MGLNLVDWYLRRGYEIVGEMRWEGKTYDSWIFEKREKAQDSAAQFTAGTKEPTRMTE